MANKSGSVIGGILLTGGSCIGAGMVGLPILTGFAGFFPSVLMFLIAWAFMTVTALLLVEVNGWFSKQVNLLSMSESTLGRWGKNLCWVTYLFLFYALLIAYISGSGSLVSTMVDQQLPAWAGSLVFVLLFGWVVYLGTQKVDLFNRGLMFAKIGFFILLVVVGVHYLRPGLLLRTEPKYVFSALPLLVIAFGFHNMIPSLTAYLNGDLKKVRMTIIGGSLMTLIIYLIWEILVLGIVPLRGPHGLIATLNHDQEASQAMAAMVKSPLISMFSQGLAFFALLTSFLAQALSLVHFLADGFKVDHKNQESAGLCALALLPPLALSLIYPQLFFKALNFAGGICAVVLFGILPVLMVWIGRYRKEASKGYQVPGGRATLVGVLIIALFIFILQLSSMVGYELVPDPHRLRGM